jgi:trehalose/maltose transport system substrate-binding protein
MRKGARRIKLLGILIGLASMMLPAIAPGATVTIVCGGAAGSFEPCRMGAQSWAQTKGHEVRVIRSTASSSTARRLYLDLLAAQADDVDVLEIHIDSAGTLAKHLVDLKSIAGHADEHFPAALEAFTVGDRLVGVPWYLSVGRLFYRRDLLEKYQLSVPQTWEELARCARIVQDGERTAGHPEFSGYVFQGRPSEELTVNALEWFASYTGPGVVAADGAVVVDNPINKAALMEAASWPGSIAPPAVLEMGSAESLRFFIDGNAAFLRYWSNGLARTLDPASAVRGRVAMTDLPKGSVEGRHPEVISGFGLAVSRYSRAPELAVDLVAWLTSEAEEKRRALAFGYDPSRPALYEDPDLLASYPYYPELRLSLAAAVPSPARITGKKYDQVSEVFWEAVHRALSRRAPPSAVLDDAAATLRRMSSSWQD